MTCRLCNESARENSHGVVMDLVYDEDGNASYICLKCVKEALRSQLDL